MICKTFVVNLTRRADKRVHMEAEFAKLKEMGTDLNHEFFQAIDGADSEAISKFNFDAANWHDPNNLKKMTMGEVGCSLSHWSIWNEVVKLVEKNKEFPENSNFLILEDDVIFLDNFESNCKSYIEEIDIIPFDMIYLHRKPLNARNEANMTKHIVNVHKSYWTCAYIIKYSGAKKLVNSGFLNNLIPVDEFLPVMYGYTANGFEKYFETAEKLRCFAVSPSLLKLTANAFNDSETFHSGAFSSPSDKKFIFEDGKEFVCFYAGPRIGHSYDRFQKYCKLYGIPVTLVDFPTDYFQVDTWNTYFLSWAPERLKSTFVIMIVVSPTDTCNIIPVSSPTEILQNFKLVINKPDQIVLSRGDKNTSKMIICGWAQNISKQLKSYQDYTKNFANPKTKTFSMMMAISAIMNNDIMITDNKSYLFHLLDTGDIKYNHKSSKVIVSKNDVTPCIILASDKNSIVSLNRAEDYTGNGWNEYYGFSVPKQPTTSDQPTSAQPRIYISYRPGTNIINFMSKINYPKDLMKIAVNDQFEISKKFLESDCDYYFFINNKCVLENPETLNELLSMNKDVIAPMLRSGDNAWTNFWGDLDEKGYYRRSFDYFDIIDNKRQGCWNVPYITNSYLIKRNILEKNPGIFTDESQMDLDMRICYNLRKADMFMYVCNLSRYGYLMSKEQYKISNEINEDLASIISTGDVTLFSIFDRRQEWEQKYLHPNIRDNIKNMAKIKYSEVCSDIYTFMLFTEDFCTDLIKLAETNNKWSGGRNQHKDPRLGSDYYENVPTVDVQLFQLGLEKIWNEIVFNYIAKVAHELYSYYITKSINLAFVVRYKYEEQNSLRPHHDSSSYTVNIALNRGKGVDYTEGGCRFIRQNYVLKDQEPGSCAIHCGRLVAYHEGLPITSGTRYILVSFIN